VGREEFFCLKAAALLHQPPIKAWLAAGKLGTPNFDFRGEALKIAKEALEGTVLEDVDKYLTDSRIKASDVLAAGVNKWLLSELVGEDESALAVSEVKIKNIFNPSFSITLERVPEPRIISEFTSSIRDTLRSFADFAIAYNVLYACYEPYWILKGLPVGPDDTRAPTHSVFDHSYATASILNWFSNGTEKVEGILLFVDLLGPQRFISGSRKLRDLWISSYFVSALAWHLLWIFVKNLGPDVLLIPTCRDNQFYYHSLLAELKRNNVNEMVLQKVKSIAKELTAYDADEDIFPRFPIIPATATLILPSINVLNSFEEFKDIKTLGDLERFVENKYREVWKEIFQLVLDSCKESKEDGVGVFLKNVSSTLEECKKFGFDRVPPLPIRVIAISIDKLFQFGGKIDDYELYHYMFQLLNFEQGRRKIFRATHEEKLKLFEMTSQPRRTWPVQRERGFEYCTVCGYLPAIIIMPSDWRAGEGEENEYDRILRDLEIEAEAIRPIFSPGERLCPYCLIKRLISLDGLREKVFSQLIGVKTSEREWKIRFPSVADVAITSFKKTLIDKAERIKFNDKLVESVVGKATELLGMEPKTLRGRTLLQAEEELLRELGKIEKRDFRETLKLILTLDAEQTILKDRNSFRRWSRFIRTINQETIEYKPDVSPLQPYYALISFDGDNMGKILNGRIEEGLRIEVKEYIRNVPEGDAKTVIEIILEDKTEDAQKILEKKGVKVLKEKIEKLSSIFAKLSNSGKIFVSPSYHTSLSRAIMRSAIRDSRIVNSYHGLVVYAGGDDLLAVMPIAESLNAVHELRKSFNLPSGVEGFDALVHSESLIPSLVAAGRSFSVYFAHYKTPLYSCISRNRILLEELAKSAEWPSLSFKKDTLVLTYSPRGGEISALIPLGPSLVGRAQKKSLAETLKQISSIVKEIEEDIFSTSLLYDFENNSKTIAELIESDSIQIAESLVEYIFRRNTIGETNRKAKKWAPYTENLKDKYTLTCLVESKGKQEERLFIKEFIKALFIYRLGIRGGAS